MARREQRTFATVGFDRYRKATRRQRFLEEMNLAMPWDELMALVEPFYPKEGQRGRPVTPLKWMLKLYYVQLWFGLSDPETEEVMHDSYAVQKFLGLDLGRESPPDETTILRFRHLIEEHNLGPKMLEIVNRHLAAHGIRVRRGTIVDATVIHAPTSTKNEEQTRDPEMGSTKKGENWEFGAKLHVGVDSQTKLIHSVAMTPANVHDSQVVGELLHGEERRVYGDRAYVGKEEVIRQKAPEAKSFIERRAVRNRPLSEEEKRKNRRKSAIRCRVEHIFGLIKHRFGWRKVRFRGIAKNLQYAFGMAAAVNVYLYRKVLVRQKVGLLSG